MTMDVTKLFIHHSGNETYRLSGFPSAFLGRLKFEASAKIFSLKIRIDIPIFQ